jgi:hypothetical protein
MQRSMTKSAVAFARTAYAVGQRALPRYGRPHAQRKFTQPQLFALLALREFLRLDYRGLVAWLGEWGELRRALGLRADALPHYTTLQKAHDRLLKGGAPTVPWPPP